MFLPFASVYNGTVPYLWLMDIMLKWLLIKGNIFFSHLCSNTARTLAIALHWLNSIKSLWYNINKQISKIKLVMHFSDGAINSDTGAVHWLKNKMETFEPKYYSKILRTPRKKYRHFTRWEILKNVFSTCFKNWNTIFTVAGKE